VAPEAVRSLDRFWRPHCFTGQRTIENGPGSDRFCCAAASKCVAPPVFFAMLECMSGWSRAQESVCLVTECVDPVEAVMALSAQLNRIGTLLAMGLVAAIVLGVV
jgi:hypothetical protein